MQGTRYEILLRKIFQGLRYKKVQICIYIVTIYPTAVVEVAWAAADTYL